MVLLPHCLCLSDDFLLQHAALSSICISQQGVFDLCSAYQAAVQVFQVQQLDCDVLSCSFDPGFPHLLQQCSSIPVQQSEQAQVTDRQRLASQWRSRLCLPPLGAHIRQLQPDNPCYTDELVVNQNCFEAILAPQTLRKPQQQPCTCAPYQADCHSTLPPSGTFVRGPSSDRSTVPGHLIPAVRR